MPGRGYGKRGPFMPTLTSDERREKKKKLSIVELYVLGTEDGVFKDTSFITRVYYQPLNVNRR